MHAVPLCHNSIGSRLLESRGSLQSGLVLGHGQGLKVRGYGTCLLVPVDRQKKENGVAALLLGCNLHFCHSTFVPASDAALGT